MPSLRAEATAFVLRLEQHEREQTRAHNCLKGVLAECQSFQDVRDVLPLPLLRIAAHQKPWVFDEIVALPRTRPEGFLFEDKPLKKHQFKEIVDLLENRAALLIL